jgi:hypothetical protein
MKEMNMSLIQGYCRVTKRLLGRLGCRVQANAKMDLKK